MISSLSINEHDRTYSGWFAARRSQARIHNMNSPLSALANIPYIPQCIHSHSRSVPTSLRQHRRRAQISIAVLPHRPPAARFPNASRRDFVPWRFSDAGYRSAW
jgi:hypothetical protein